MKKNPFRLSYISIAIICCFAVSIIFYGTNYIENKVVQQKYNQEKLQTMMRDLELQMQIIEELSIRIASNYEFHPIYINEYKSRELSMLKTFKQYRYNSVLAEEIAIYYGGKKFFFASGITQETDVYLQNKIKSQEERENFQTMLIEGLEGVWSNMKLLKCDGKVYVMIPRSVFSADYKRAILFYVLDEATLGKRLLMTGIEVQGNLALYNEDLLLYCNQKTACTQEQKLVQTVDSFDGRFTLCYLPDKTYNIQGGLFYLQLFLVFVDIFVCLVVANGFSKRAYLPIQKLPIKYQEMIAPCTETFDNAIDELEYMLDTMQKHSVEMLSQIRNKQEVLQKQLLQMLLNGVIYEDIEIYLDSANIILSGPSYYVATIFLEKKRDMELMCEIKQGLLTLTEPQKERYVYPILNEEEMLIHVICSICSEKQKEQLTEEICDVVNSFTDTVSVCTGKIYHSISFLHASYLESMENKSQKNTEEAQEQFLVSDTEELMGISDALAHGDEAKAVKELEHYVQKLSQRPISSLMCRYIFWNFLIRIEKLGKKYQIAVQDYQVSMIISARNMQEFKDAAQNLICSFCKSMNEIKNEEKHRVYEYINQHFAEYDLTMDKMVRELDVTEDVIGKVIFDYTGKGYREYIIYLRIEYAKALLQEEKYSVAEVCYKVGYVNVSYFIKLFKKMTGTTPLKFKQK